MAHQFWGLNKGQHQTDVVTQSTDPSKNVVVEVDLSVTMNREEVLIKLDEIKNVILQGNWPPA